MKHICLALLIIAGALLLFAIVLTHFAINTRHPSPNIGAAYLAVWILAAGGVTLGAWIAALVLGWWGWEFWSHSSLPKVPV
jgi:hypothetical protein